MNFQPLTNDVAVSLDFKLSKIEKTLFDEFSSMLECNGFKYLSVPTSLDHDFTKRQGIDVVSLKVEHNGIESQLGGSAEQGILQHFSGTRVEPSRIYAINSCFRVEEKLESPLRLREFKKLEQFVFTTKLEVTKEFNNLMNNVYCFYDALGIDYRLVNKTKTDVGYHSLKYDIEIATESYGWIETHSCTYFEEEQTKRFGITGATHTISNTGLASPRVLIPFVEGSAKIPKDLQKRLLSRGV